MLPDGKSTSDGAGGSDPYELSLPLSGWLLRIARGTGRRPALEVYSRTGCEDVSAAAVIGAALLRGTRRGHGSGRPWSLAWGQVPLDADTVHVVFRRRQESVIARPVLLLGLFWVAEVDSGFRSVTVSAGPVRATARVMAA
ncbi:hypothetical protein [Actinomadura oligospora]|uniref:hypothetical protein n=1 Tax=Actinomadura oligospora TaxID=111804 RepID=UPI00047B38E4|nr:hypothetical protein [Actinomadura oligospora]